MLTGLVVGPAACGTIVGIDTNRYVDDAGAASSSSSSSGGSSSGSTSGDASGSVTPDDGGNTSDAPQGTCNTGQCLAMGGTCSEGSCRREQCSALDILCPKTFVCPEGQTCVFICHGDGCKGLDCSGGGTCVFDCRDGSCESASCDANTCKFICGTGSSCDKAECRGANKVCEQECANGSGAKDFCTKLVECCPGNGDDDDAPMRTCPGKNPNCH